MEKKFDYKKFFIHYGIVVGIIGLIFLIMIYSVKFSKKSWHNNLKVCVEKVFDENEPNTWNVEKFIPINNPFSLSAACYEVHSRKTGEKSYAVIIRETSFYGPLSVVFLCDDEANVSFVGYSSLHGRVATQLKSKNSDKKLDYWKEKIPEIIEVGQNER